MKKLTPQPQEATRDDYRQTCAKSLGLRENADWKTINDIRDSIQLTIERARQETSHKSYGEVLKKLQGSEEERQRWILELGLDKNSSEPEVRHFAKITEFVSSSESKRFDLTSILRLKETATWEDIRKTFLAVRELAERGSDSEEQMEKRICELLTIPADFYKGLVESIQLGEDLSALEYLGEKRTA